MAEVIGTLSEIKEFVTKTGKKTFTLVVDGKRYSGGFDAPKAKPGDRIAFNTVQNGEYINADVKSIKVLPPDPSAPAPQAAGRAYGGDNRQDIISRQAASNTALEFLKLAASFEALDIKKTAKADDKLAALEALMDQYTARFYEHNTGVPFKSIAPEAEQALDNVGSTAPTPQTWQ